MFASNLDTPLVYLKGVGPKRAELLQKELGIATYEQLLNHYPFRYIDRTRFYKINELNPDMPLVQVIGRITSKEVIGEKHKKRIVAKFTDDTGTMDLVWFQSLKWVEDHVMRGSIYIAFGKPAWFGNSFSISHPDLETYPRQTGITGNLTLQPIYHTSEKMKKGFLDSKGIQKLIHHIIELHINEVRETLPAYILEKYKLISRKEALIHVHFPANTAMLQHAERRLKFEELFFIQLQLLHNKQLRSLKFKGALFNTVGERVNTFYNSMLPFDLTNAQKRVIKEIRIDTQRGSQMNRLIQGDVGSGKTVVALISMLLANDNGYQACMMAPTEILARQHYQSLVDLLKGELVNVAVLTGNTTKKQRSILHQQLESGEIDILVGTHALIEDKVQFKNLGLVVIDEQHRFGVEQRAKLWRKNVIPPHILVMTATPIPPSTNQLTIGNVGELKSLLEPSCKPGNHYRLPITYSSKQQPFFRFQHPPGSDDSSEFPFEYPFGFP